MYYVNTTNVIENIKRCNNIYHTCCNSIIYDVIYSCSQKKSKGENTMATVIITANLESEIRDIRALEAKINELDELKKEKEALIKSVLDEAGVEEMKIGAFMVRFTNVVRNNFNTTAFKKKYLELYNAFIKQSTYRKFTIV